MGFYPILQALDDLKLTSVLVKTICVVGKNSTISSSLIFCLKCNLHMLHAQQLNHGFDSNTYRVIFML